MREITPRELSAWMGDGKLVYLLDVREPWEHQTAAIAGSVLVPLGQLQARAADLTPPAGALVVTYCHHGMRSQSGAALLERAGVPEVCSLAGGIDAWSREIDPSVPRY